MGQKNGGSGIGMVNCRGRFCRNEQVPHQPE